MLSSSVHLNMKRQLKPLKINRGHTQSPLNAVYPRFKKIENMKSELTKSEYHTNESRYFLFAEPSIHPLNFLYTLPNLSYFYKIFSLFLLVNLVKHSIIPWHWKPDYYQSRRWPDQQPENCPADRLHVFSYCRGTRVNLARKVPTSMIYRWLVVF